MEGANTAARPQRLDGIQWLRGAAALLVVIEHAKNAISVDFFKLAPDRSPLSIFPFAVGVDIFFVISGFIMAHASAPLFARAGSWRPFMIRRIARVAPLYWLVTTIMIALFFATGSRMWRESGWGAMAASYLFLPATNPEGATFPMLVTGWTLNYEMAFYAVFALFIGFSRGVALSLTAGTIVGAVALGLALKPSSIALAFWTDPIIFEFVAGIGLFAAWNHGRLALGPFARKALVVSAIVALALQAPYGAGHWRALIWGGPALMLVAAALPSRGEGAGSRWAELAGDLSYATYLVHLPVILVLQHLLRRWPADALLWFGLFPALVALITFASAWILHAVVERPILRWARRTTAPH
jgi:peptidoglycan/LPS O-acetylase OafA/YrhL